MDLFNERQKRDEALDLFDTFRAGLVAEARDVAVRIARKNGRVTSPEVIECMTDRFPDSMAKHDRRFMGAVFRGPTWERIGFINAGYHCRPVSVWKLREQP